MRDHGCCLAATAILASIGADKVFVRVQTLIEVAKHSFRQPASRAVVFESPLIPTQLSARKSVVVIRDGTTGAHLRAAVFFNQEAMRGRRGAVPDLSEAICLWKSEDRHKLRTLRRADADLSLRPVRARAQADQRTAKRKWRSGGANVPAQIRTQQASNFPIHRNCCEFKFCPARRQSQVRGGHQPFQRSRPWKLEQRRIFRRSKSDRQLVFKRRPRPGRSFTSIRAQRSSTTRSAVVSPNTEGMAVRALRECANHIRCAQPRRRVHPLALDPSSAPGPMMTRLY